MFEIIDLHNHSLPGLDDGADTFEKMCDMLEMSYGEGVRSICFTPHYNNSALDCTPPQILGAYWRAVEYCSTHIPDMYLYVGSEMSYHYDCIEAIQKGKLFTIAGSRYVLVDFFNTNDVLSIIRGLERLLNCGYIPIVAHVERYACLFGRFEDVRKMSTLGAVIQVNASSVCGKTMSKSHRFCMKLLHANLVDIVASDAHNLVNRPPNMKKAAEIVNDKFGCGYAKQIFCDNPKLIISNNRL